MPQIAHIANLWTLLGHPAPTREWTLERKIRAVAAAGFDGITTRLTPEHRRLAGKHGLRHLLGFISTSDPAEFPKLIREQKEAGAAHINVQLDDHDTPPATAAKHWRRMVREGERIGGVTLSLEAHRDTCTETPEKTYEIAERYRRAAGEPIKFNFDFSHFAVVKHLAPAHYAERLLDHPELVRNSEQAHLRPFNGHHCQVPVLHRGRLTPEAKSYLIFARALLELWNSAPSNRNKTLFVCPEMGPLGPDGSGYNITGLPSSWSDAVALRVEIARLWKSIQK
ncbi:MAG: sugar phosphate isomerase/epimerase family protein [Opitutaceae bacterium]